MAVHLLAQFRQDDFAAACQKYDRSVEEFEVTDEEQYPSGGSVGPIARQITVALRGKGPVRLYNGGHGSHWIVDFENDLKAGAFN